MVCSLILLTAFIQTDQSTLICPVSPVLLTVSKNASLQEKTKYQYIGMDKCASKCHNNKEMGFQYDIVKKSPHANAYKALSSNKAARFAKNVSLKEMPNESTVCLKCHTTGGGLDSTFFAATYRKEEGVTCEACHKGAFITKAFIPTENDCLKCHNNTVHRMPEFDFSNDCKRIAHNGPRVKSAKT